MPSQIERRSTAQRVCFQLQVKPDQIGAYRAAHAAVWPDMLTALYETGWRNYSLFLRDDGLLIGYFETADLQAARDGMAATVINDRWQCTMAPFFADLDVPADEGFLQLTEVFHLEDQLAELAASAAEHSSRTESDTSGVSASDTEIHESFTS